MTDGLQRPADSVRRWLAPLVLAVVAAPVFFFRLGSYGIVNGDEALYHYAARHMLESGDWFRVEFAGQHRLYDTFTHAPLFFWTKALVLLVLGDSLWSMRILSASFGLLSLGATWALTRQLANRRAALIAALIQLTTFQLVYLHGARTGEMDPILVFLFTLAPLLFLRWLETGRGLLGHHLCLVAILNLKLALVLVPIAAELVCFALVPASRARLRAWLRLAAVVLPLGSAWHVAQAALHWGPFLEVVKKMAGQAASAAGAVNPDLGPLGNLRFYAAAVLTGSYPYSLVAPIAIAACLTPRRSPEERVRWRLLACYGFAIALFCTAVSLHQSWYVLPLYPVLSLVTATWLDGLLSRPPPRWQLAAIGAAAGLALWLRLPIFDVNPFATTAAFFRQSLELRGPGPAAPALGAAATLALFAALGFASAPLLATRKAARWLGGGLCALLLSVGGLRVTAPLRFTDYVSPMDRLARQLEARRSRGEPITYPVYVPGFQGFILRYHFADRYIIEPVPPGQREAVQAVVMLTGERSP